MGCFSTHEARKYWLSLLFLMSRRKNILFSQKLCKEHLFGAIWYLMVSYYYGCVKTSVTICRELHSRYVIPNSSIQEKMYPSFFSWKFVFLWTQSKTIAQYFALCHVHFFLHFANEKLDCMFLLEACPMAINMLGQQKFQCGSILFTRKYLAEGHSSTNNYIIWDEKFNGMAISMVYALFCW